MQKIQKKTQTKEKGLSHHCLPIIKFKKYRTNNVIF